MKKKIFCTRKKFIDQIKSWCYHAINNFFSWSRKILLLTFLYIKPYLIYYAIILATIFFLIKKKKLYGRRYKHIFYCLADIDCILVDLNPVWIVFNNYILLLSFYYIYCIPLLYYIFSSFDQVFWRTNLLHTFTIKKLGFPFKSFSKWLKCQPCSTTMIKMPVMLINDA